MTQPNAQRTAPAGSWQLHWRLVGGGALLALPVLFLDLSCLAPRVGAYFDLRGLVIVSYVVLWFIEAVLATILLGWTGGLNAWAVHAVAAVVIGMVGVALCAVV